MEREATITYTRPLAKDFALIGIAWDTTERHSDDFDLESLGKVYACGTESRMKRGWVVYRDNDFSGDFGDTIELKETVIGG